MKFYLASKLVHNNNWITNTINLFNKIYLIYLHLTKYWAVLERVESEMLTFSTGASEVRPGNRSWRPSRSTCSEYFQTSRKEGPLWKDSEESGDHFDTISTVKKTVGSLRRNCKWVGSIDRLQDLMSSIGRESQVCLERKFKNNGYNINVIHRAPLLRKNVNLRLILETCSSLTTKYKHNTNAQHKQTTKNAQHKTQHTSTTQTHTQAQHTSTTHKHNTNNTSTTQTHNTSTTHKHNTNTQHKHNTNTQAQHTSTTQTHKHTQVSNLG